MSSRKEAASSGGSGRGKSAAAAAAASPLPSSPAAASSSNEDPFVRSLLHYEAWKETLPVLYDCFIHSNLEWPSYALAWGPVQPELTPAEAAAKAAAANVTVVAPASSAGAAAPEKPHLTAAALTPQTYDTSYVTQTFFFSRSTDSRLERDRWIGSPNMLLVADLYYPNQYRTQDIAKMKNFDEDQRNPCLALRKKIVHPGEINRIKMLPQYPDLIATHTDSPLVYVWNTNTQPSRRSALNADPSVPDLTLQGHLEREDCSTLYYALDCSSHAPRICSGGSDQRICLWDIRDYCSTLTTTATVAAAAAGGARAPAPKKHIERLLSPRHIFTGHTAHVEEVCFHPTHADLLCSVGDDRFLMIWDTREKGSKPVLKLVPHTNDVNAVHWNAVNDNLLVTGSSDTTVKLIDLRRISNSSSFTAAYASHPASIRSHTSSASSSPAVIHTFHGHQRNVTNVQWHSNGEFFASGSDDGDLCIWSTKGIDTLHKHVYPAHNAMETESGPSASPSAPASSGAPPASLWDGSDGEAKHLLFRHAGHRTAVVNFSFNPFVKDGWTLASFSDDSADETLVGGGRLHVWRPTDLLTKDFERIAEEFSSGGGSSAGARGNEAAPAAAAVGASTLLSSPTLTIEGVAPMMIDGAVAVVAGEAIDAAIDADMAPPDEPEEGMDE